MLTLYYRIWVSLFLAAMAAQKQNRKVSLFFALTVLALSNFINVLTILILLLVFGARIDVLGIFPENRIVRNITIGLVFFAPNYFLLVYNNKHEYLLEKYQQENLGNLGLRYFFISGGIFLLLVIASMIFPEIFGLK